VAREREKMSGKNLSNILKSDCRSCSTKTRHEVLHEVVQETNEEWCHEADTWQLVRCLGCHTISFRHRKDDFDDYEEDHEGTVRHVIDINVYPSVVANHRGLQATYYLPPLIRKVYGQTVKALSERATVLASIGLRACIEAVCNDLKLSGANLDKRIDQLYKAGHVSNGDKKRLHAIRFLGNDAVHEIKEPQSSELRIALEIVEHLLNTVYILERKARNLETVIETYPDFLKLLRSCVEKHIGENAVNLSGLLGRQRRLVGQSIDVYEAQLKNEITKGTVDFLKMGQLQIVAGKEIQLYELIKAAIVEDELPF
jgi:Domain of unknown function (DUF4145)